MTDLIAQLAAMYLSAWNAGILDLDTEGLREYALLLLGDYDNAHR